jgi:predicted porin
LEINLMKKSLLAVAVAAALPAVALAQTNVTLYGIVDAGLAHIDQGAGTGSSLKVQSGLATTNRWGLRGTESLGGGLNAIFNLEAGLRSDTGAGTAAGGIMDFSRRAVVGLNGGFGEFRLGRDYTPFFKALGTGDALGYAYLGNLVSHAIAGGNSVRFSNALWYDTPNMGGFGVSIGYGLGEVPGNNSAGRGISISGGYNAGPIGINLAYETVNDAAGNNAFKSTALAGGYDFGAFALKAAFAKTDKAAAGADLNLANIGVRAPVGPGTLMGQFTRQSYESGGRTNVFSLAYNYPLSKRTSVYGTLSQASNSGQAAGNVLGILRGGDDNYAAAAANTNVRGFGVGIRHDF